MLAQKTRRKAAIRPDKVEHFTHTFENLSPEIYIGMQIANADVDLTYTCIVQCSFVTSDFAPDCEGTGLPGCG